MSLEAHLKSGQKESIRTAVITCSDTRSKEEDSSGALIVTMLEQEGHEIHSYTVVKDDKMLIQGEVRTLVAGQVDVILVNGGTGLAPRDTTFESLSAMFDRSVPGFGELFRMLSYEEIGAASMLSRAQAGLIGKTLLFSMPGSRNAVQLAMEKLIVPQLKHMVSEIRK